LVVREFVLSIREETCAVVVSYNAEKNIYKTILKLSESLKHVYIVDNGSAEASLKVLDDVCSQFNNVTIKKLYENKGIGYALNLGIEKAKELNCKWLLTMDQDSLINRDMIVEFGITIRNNPTILSLTPNIIINGLKYNTQDSYVEYAITSGNLINLSVFDRIGKYNEDLFIDSVDFDFSLRLRKAGYKILRVSKAVMEHELGEPANIPKFILKYYTKHSHVRRYYMTRNLLYMWKKYCFSFPKFIFKLSVMQIFIFMCIPFFDKEPKKSFNYIFRGIKDFFGNKYGKLVECKK
jgi:rhamnosyltransferase